MSVRSPRIVGGRRGPSKGSRSFFCDCFMEGKKIRLSFLGLFFAWFYHCPAEGVSVSGEVGAWAQMKYKSGQR